MNYNEARYYIKSLSPRGIRPGLDNITRLCGALGNPQNGLCVIHIAGTNGKGSVGAFLGSILNASGIDVGRFVSPPVGDYLEAFTYNGIPVSEGLYTECAEAVRDALSELEAEGIFPTSFEAETAIAFLIFSRLSPGYVILECGMGGRLDATNIISAPYASVITSVSLDHNKFLGNTLAAIAKEKSGIIKDNCPVITCAQRDEVMEVINRAAASHDAPLFIADDISDIRLGKEKTVFKFEGAEYEIGLGGTYQPENAALAVKTSQVLGISRDSIHQGLKSAVWEYRFEQIGKFVLDGAHNEDAARELAASIKACLDGSTAFICGCFRDKAYEEIAKITSPLAVRVYCVTPPSERGLQSSLLCREFEKNGVIATDSGEMPAAIKDAYRSGADNIVIFGSLSILAEAKRLIKEMITDGEV